MKNHGDDVSVVHLKQVGYDSDSDSAKDKSVLPDDHIEENGFLYVNDFISSFDKSISVLLGSNFQVANLHNLSSDVEQSYEDISSCSDVTNSLDGIESPKSLKKLLEEINEEIRGGEIKGSSNDGENFKLEILTLLKPIIEQYQDNLGELNLSCEKLHSISSGAISNEGSVDYSELLAAIANGLYNVRRLKGAYTGNNISVEAGKAVEDVAVGTVDEILNQLELIIETQNNILSVLKFINEKKAQCDVIDVEISSLNIDNSIAEIEALNDLFVGFESELTEQSAILEDTKNKLRDKEEDFQLSSENIFIDNQKQAIGNIYYRIGVLKVNLAGKVSDICADKINSFKDRMSALNDLNSVDDEKLDGLKTDFTELQDYLLITKSMFPEIGSFEDPCNIVYEWLKSLSGIKDDLINKIVDIEASLDGAEPISYEVKKWVKEELLHIDPIITKLTSITDSFSVLFLDETIPSYSEFSALKSELEENKKLVLEFQKILFNKIKVDYQAKVKECQDIINSYSESELKGNCDKIIASFNELFKEYNYIQSLDISDVDSGLEDPKNILSQFSTKLLERYKTLPDTSSLKKFLESFAEGDAEKDAEYWNNLSDLPEKFARLNDENDLLSNLYDSLLDLQSSFPENGIYLQDKTEYLDLGYGSFQDLLSKCCNSILEDFNINVKFVVSKNLLDDSEEYEKNIDVIIEKLILLEKQNVILQGFLHHFPSQLSLDDFELETLKEGVVENLKSFVVLSDVQVNDKITAIVNDEEFEEINKQVEAYKEALTEINNNASYLLTELTNFTSDIDFEHRDLAKLKKDMESFNLIKDRVEKVLSESDSTKKEIDGFISDNQEKFEKRKKQASQECTEILDKSDKVIKVIAELNKGLADELTTRNESLRVNIKDVTPDLIDLISKSCNEFEELYANINECFAQIGKENYNFDRQYNEHVAKITQDQINNAFSSIIESFVTDVKGKLDSEFEKLSEEQSHNVFFKKSADGNIFKLNVFGEILASKIELFISLSDSLAEAKEILQTSLKQSGNIVIKEGEVEININLDEVFFGKFNVIFDKTLSEIFPFDVKDRRDLIEKINTKIESEYKKITDLLGEKSKAAFEAYNQKNAVEREELEAKLNARTEIIKAEASYNSLQESFKEKINHFFNYFATNESPELFKKFASHLPQINSAYTNFLERSFGIDSEGVVGVNSNNSDILAILQSVIPFVRPLLSYENSLKGEAERVESLLKYWFSLDSEELENLNSCSAEQKKQLGLELSEQFNEGIKRIDDLRKAKEKDHIYNSLELKINEYFHFLKLNDEDKILSFYDDIDNECRQFYACFSTSDTSAAASGPLSSKEGGYVSSSIFGENDIKNLRSMFKDEELGGLKLLFQNHCEQVHEKAAKLKSVKTIETIKTIKNAIDESFAILTAEIIAKPGILSCFVAENYSIDDVKDSGPYMEICSNLEKLERAYISCLNLPPENLTREVVNNFFNGIENQELLKTSLNKGASYEAHFASCKNVANKIQDAIIDCELLQWLDPIPEDIKNYFSSRKGEFLKSLDSGLVQEISEKLRYDNLTLKESNNGLHSHISELNKNKTNNKNNFLNGTNMMYISLGLGLGLGLGSTLISGQLGSAFGGQNNAVFNETSSSINNGTQLANNTNGVHETSLSPFNVSDHGQNATKQILQSAIFSQSDVTYRNFTVSNETHNFIPKFDILSLIYNRTIDYYNPLTGQAQSLYSESPDLVDSSLVEVKNDTVSGLVAEGVAKKDAFNTVDLYSTNGTVLGEVAEGGEKIVNATLSGEVYSQESVDFKDNSSVVSTLEGGTSGQLGDYHFPNAGENFIQPIIRSSKVQSALNATNGTYQSVFSLGGATNGTVLGEVAEGGEKIVNATLSGEVYSQESVDFKDNSSVVSTLEGGTSGQLGDYHFPNAGENFIQPIIRSSKVQSALNATNGTYQSVFSLGGATNGTERSAIDSSLDEEKNDTVPGLVAEGVAKKDAVNTVDPYSTNGTVLGEVAEDGEKIVNGTLSSEVYSQEVDFIDNSSVASKVKGGTIGELGDYHFPNAGEHFIQPIIHSSKVQSALNATNGTYQSVFSLGGATNGTVRSAIDSSLDEVKNDTVFGEVAEDGVLKVKVSEEVNVVGANGKTTETRDDASLKNQEKFDSAKSELFEKFNSELSTLSDDADNSIRIVNDAASNFKELSENQKLLDRLLAISADIDKISEDNLEEKIEIINKFFHEHQNISSLQDKISSCEAHKTAGFYLADKDRLLSRLSGIIESFEINFNSLKNEYESGVVHGDGISFEDYNKKLSELESSYNALIDEYNKALLNDVKQKHAEIKVKYSSFEITKPILEEGIKIEKIKSTSSEFEQKYRILQDVVNSREEYNGKLDQIIEIENNYKEESISSKALVKASDSVSGQDSYSDNREFESIDAVNSYYNQQIEALEARINELESKNKKYNVYIEEINNIKRDLGGVNLTSHEDVTTLISEVNALREELKTLDGSNPLHKLVVTSDDQYQAIRNKHSELNIDEITNGIRSDVESNNNSIKSIFGLQINNLKSNRDIKINKIRIVEQEKINNFERVLERKISSFDELVKAFSAQVKSGESYINSKEVQDIIKHVESSRGKDLSYDEVSSVVLNLENIIGELENIIGKSRKIIGTLENDSSTDINESNFADDKAQYQEFLEESARITGSEPNSNQDELYRRIKTANDLFKAEEGELGNLLSRKEEIKTIGAEVAEKSKELVQSELDSVLNEIELRVGNSKDIIRLFDEINGLYDKVTNSSNDSKSSKRTSKSDKSDYKAQLDELIESKKSTISKLKKIEELLSENKGFRAILNGVDPNSIETDELVKASDLKSIYEQNSPEKINNLVSTAELLFAKVKGVDITKNNGFAFDPLQGLRSEDEERKLDFSDLESKNNSADEAFKALLGMKKSLLKQIKTIDEKIHKALLKEHKKINEAFVEKKGELSVNAENSINEIPHLLKTSIATFDVPELDIMQDTKRKFEAKKEALVKAKKDVQEGLTDFKRECGFHSKKDYHESYVELLTTYNNEIKSLNEYSDLGNKKRFKNKSHDEELTVRLQEADVKAAELSKNAKAIETAFEAEIAKLGKEERRLEIIIDNFETGFADITKLKSLNDRQLPNVEDETKVSSLQKLSESFFDIEVRYKEALQKADYSIIEEMGGEIETLKSNKRTLDGTINNLDKKIADVTRHIKLYKDTQVNVLKHLQENSEFKDIISHVFPGFVVNSNDIVDNAQNRLNALQAQKSGLLNNLSDHVYSLDELNAKINSLTKSDGFIKSLTEESRKEIANDYKFVADIESKQYQEADNFIGSFYANEGVKNAIEALSQSIKKFDSVPDLLKTELVRARGILEEANGIELTVDLNVEIGKIIGQRELIESDIKKLHQIKSKIENDIAELNRDSNEPSYLGESFAKQLENINDRISNLSAIRNTYVGIESSSKLFQLQNDLNKFDKYKGEFETSKNLINELEAIVKSFQDEQTKFGSLKIDQRSAEDITEGFLKSLRSFDSKYKEYKQAEEKYKNAIANLDFHDARSHLNYISKLNLGFDDKEYEDLFKNYREDLENNISRLEELKSTLNVLISSTQEYNKKCNNSLVCKFSFPRIQGLIDECDSKISKLKENLQSATQDKFPELLDMKKKSDHLSQRKSKIPSDREYLELAEDVNNLDVDVRDLYDQVSGSYDKCKELSKDQVFIDQLRVVNDIASKYPNKISYDNIENIYLKLDDRSKSRNLVAYASKINRYDEDYKKYKGEKNIVEILEKRIYSLYDSKHIDEKQKNDLIAKVDESATLLNDIEYDIRRIRENKAVIELNKAYAPYFEACKDANLGQDCGVDEFKRFHKGELHSEEPRANSQQQSSDSGFNIFGSPFVAMSTFFACAFVYLSWQNGYLTGKTETQEKVLNRIMGTNNNGYGHQRRLTNVSPDFLDEISSGR